MSDWKIYKNLNRPVLASPLDKKPSGAGKLSVASGHGRSALAVGGVALLSIAAPDAAAQVASASGPFRLNFETAASLAASNSPAVDRARRSAEVAGLQSKSARAGYYPNVNVSLSLNQSAQGLSVQTDGYDYARGLRGNFLGTANVAATLPIDISGSIARQVRQSDIRARVAQLDLERAAGGAATDAEISYLTALSAQNAADIDKRILDELVELRSVVPARWPTIATLIDVELDSARQSASASIELREQEMDKLKLVLMLPLDAKLFLDPTLPPLESAEAIAKSGGDLDQRNDLALGAERVRQAELAVVQAGDARRPALSVSAYASQSIGGKFISYSGNTSNRSYGASVSFRMPVLNFDAGRSGASIKTVKLMAEQARRDLDHQRRAAELELRQAQFAYARARDRLKQLPDPDAAEKAYSNARKALLRAPPENAATLLTHVGNTRAAWRAAEMATARAYADLMISARKLRRARGG